MTDFSSEVMTELDHKISKLDRLKSVEHLITDDERDFSRDRKLTFPDMIRAILSMAERCPENKCIFIADRNYPTWNVMEHIIHAGRHFLFRCKDINSSTSLLSKFNLPNGEFDLDVSTTLTTLATNKIKAAPSRYRFLSSSSVFDYVDKENPYYTVHYRAVRFRLDGSDDYESILTDLPRDKFSAETIKKLYQMRWGIETSFRNLKYSSDLSTQHAKKHRSIQQEIWARLILYNLSFIIIHYIWEKSSKGRKKYCYAINKTRAIHLVRQALGRRKGGHPPDLEALVKAELLPVRPGRSDLRKIKLHSFVCFNYRFS